jgi:hypothetical protein
MHRNTTMKLTIAASLGSLLLSGPLVADEPAPTPAPAPAPAPTSIDPIAPAPKTDALTRARENFRISRVTYERIKKDLDELRVQPDVDPGVLADYATYLDRVRAMMEVHQNIVREMESVSIGAPEPPIADWPRIDPAEFDPALPEANDALSELDRELNESLSEFDSYLLEEQYEARRRMARMDEVSSEEMTDLAREAAAAVERLRDKGIDIDTSTPPEQQGGQQGDPSQQQGGEQGQQGEQGGQQGQQGQQGEQGGQQGQQGGQQGEQGGQQGQQGGQQGQPGSGSPGQGGFPGESDQSGGASGQQQGGETGGGGGGAAGGPMTGGGGAGGNEGADGDQSGGGASGQGGEGEGEGESGESGESGEAGDGESGTSAGGSGTSGEGGESGGGGQGGGSAGGSASGGSGDAGGSGSGSGGSGQETGTQPNGSPGSGSGNGDDEDPSTRTGDRPPADDDDIVARQLREAAERETDPELKEKLWEEYDRYKGSS